MADKDHPGARPARFSFLPVSLLLLIILYPSVEQTGRGFVFGIFYTVILLSAIYTVSERKLYFLLGLLLVILSTLIHWIGIGIGNQAFLIVSDVLGAAVLCLTAVLIIFHVLRAEQITSQKIYGALSAYLLIGIIWTLLFMILEFLVPGSFQMGQETDLRTSQMLYYSFVTLTTLGYGDVVPILPAARSMATLEALMGQLYLVIVVARLVALHITHSKSDS